MKAEQPSKLDVIISIMEENFNMKLLPYQKLLLYTQYQSNGSFYGGRRSSKKFDNYILLLHRALLMEDEEMTVVVSPKGNKEMNREGLLSWLENDYWK